MPHYSVHKICHQNTTRKEKHNKESKNKNFTAKTQNLNLKASSYKIKKQSDKKLTKHIFL